MGRIWARTLAVDDNNSGFYGSKEMSGLSNGSTILRTLWSINLWGTWGSVDQYPPGSSIARAGIIVAAAGLAPADTPTPISQAEDDWLDLVTLVPLGQIATSTNVDWQYNWMTLEDRNAKAQRLNDTGSDQSLYLSWEFTVAPDAISGFAMLGWSGATDAYVNIP
jgi:hypothetical protein